MSTLFTRMFKIILLSLIYAVTALVVLYFIIYNVIISDQINKARLADNSILLIKCSGKLNKKDFKNIIKIFDKQYNIKFSIYSVLDKSDFPYDDVFVNKLKHKEKLYKIKDDFLIYYKALIFNDRCIKCHNMNKIDSVKKFTKGEFLGVMVSKIPIKKTIRKYNKTFFIIFIVLGIALIITLYYFCRYMDSIRNDINVLLMFFKEKIQKGVYLKLKKKMNYVEFEKLKKEINGAVNSIVYFKKESEKRYIYNSLTMLPNRLKLIEDLEKKKFNLAIININKFREINDYFGFQVGDELIKIIASRLKLVLNEVYHISVDEFAFRIMYDNKNDNYNYVYKVLDKLEKPYFVKDNEIILTFRCGMSRTVDNLLTTADVALEYAKRKNEKCLCFCEIKEMLKEYEHNLKILNILVKAIKYHKIKVYYQAIVDNKTCQIVKYEALVRLCDEKGSIYMPDEFLNIAKSANLYPDITKFVFKEALRKFRNRKEMISLNLDLEDFNNEKIIKFIKNEIEKFPQPERICIELLESENITESKNAVNFMKYLKSKGIKIFIDDFGSGYSNFSYLFNFEVDGFKIDGSLIKNILFDKKSQMIVETMIAFADKGNMKIVAEYVETKEIYECVKKLGIDCSQGYFFSKPKEL